MEGEESCLKYFIPRVSKWRRTIIFMAVITTIIWLIHMKNLYDTCFRPKPVHSNEDSVPANLFTVPLFHIPLLNIKDMTQYYSEISSDTWCFHQGTNLIESKRQQKCICLPHWFGLDCGIPSSVWKSKFLQEGNNPGITLRRREKPRRIILSLVFDEAFDLLDINIRNSFSVVDIFLIAVENDSQSFYKMLGKGYFTEFHSKLMPILLNKSVFLEEEHKRISLVLSDLLNLGLKRLTDFRPDDIFVFSHVSSIISNDILLFLKLYDGYPEPLYFTLKPLLFKFSKLLKSTNKNYTLVPFKPSGCTFQFLSRMCEYSVLQFLETKCLINKSSLLLFEKHHWLLKEWNVGSEDFPSGWHCNFCCNAECMVNTIKKRKWNQKMSASISFNHENMNESVIEQIIKLNSFNGDDIIYERIPQSDLNLAPKVIFDLKKYKYLLD